MRAAMLVLFILLTGITLPAHRAGGQQNGEGARSAKQQLAENIETIHKNDVESAITDSLISWRKNRADSLRQLLDTTSTP